LYGSSPPASEASWKNHAYLIDLSTLTYGFPVCSRDEFPEANWKTHPSNPKKDRFRSPDSSNNSTEITLERPTGDKRQLFAALTAVFSPLSRSQMEEKPEVLWNLSEVGWNNCRSWLENSSRSLSERLPKSVGRNPEARWKKAPHKPPVIWRLHKTNVPYCLHSSCFL
jgi:hypothetical protein